MVIVHQVANSMVNVQERERVKNRLPTYFFVSELSGRRSRLTMFAPTLRTTTIMKTLYKNQKGKTDRDTWNFTSSYLFPTPPLCNA